MSLRTRLNLSLALTLSLIIAISAVFTLHRGRRAVEAEMNSSVELALRLMEAGTAEQWTSEDAFARWLLPLAQSHGTRHLHITIFRDGQPILATPTPAVKTPDAPGWFARWVQPESQWIERIFPLPNGSPIRMVIQADPRDEIAEVWEESLGYMRLLGLLALATYGVIHVMLGRALRPVGVILRGLEGIQAGEYASRLPPFDLPEFAQIAYTFNHMAAVLEKSQQENRTLTQRTLAIQEEERRHVAQELHDELGQSLNAIKVLAVSLRGMVTNPQGKQALTTIGQTCDGLFEAVRALMRRLRPMMLDDLGLVASLEDLIANWKARHPEVRVSFHCEPLVERWAGTANIHLFRIVQECLTNISRHAHAKAVNIRLAALPESERHSIKLLVTDDGLGFDADQPRRGFGLYGIRERALSLGGRFELNTRPGQGVRLTITLPCEYNPDDEQNAHTLGG